ncbi:hypothetical protein F9278_16415 [Streptomyces phaeolivaceus]|uniref:Secreted protein n=1 Tax=Streptomyces phaeolivaceus TaxID=2653200 RepID=A0A5P8K3B1_9ACTN|nr:hypothetical protein [Streptomyces phaeolivaceus]QFQ97534.1 hypothetical protein F9278_16415 [Streptomyces phaeolivaceus]
MRSIGMTRSLSLAAAIAAAATLGFAGQAAAANGHRTSLVASVPSGVNYVKITSTGSSSRSGGGKVNQCLTVSAARSSGPVVYADETFTVIGHGNSSCSDTGKGGESYDIPDGWAAGCVVYELGVNALQQGSC